MDVQYVSAWMMIVPYFLVGLAVFSYLAYAKTLGWTRRTLYIPILGGALLYTIGAGIYSQPILETAGVCSYIIEISVLLLIGGIGSMIATPLLLLVLLAILSLQ